MKKNHKEMVIEILNVYLKYNKAHGFTGVARLLYLAYCEALDTLTPADRDYVQNEILNNHKQ